MATKTPSPKFDATAWKKKYKEPKKYSYLKRDVRDQVVVYRENYDDEKFGNWLDHLEGKMADKYGEKRNVRVVNFCGSCDTSLLLLVAKGIKTVITTEVAKKGSSASGGGLQGEPGLFFASNVKVKFPTPKAKNRIKDLYQPCQQYNKGDVSPVTVAVFDTGLIRDEFTEFLTPPFLNPCVRQLTQGWNFTVPNDKFDDDHPLSHGSNVSRFIVDQCMKVEGGRPVRILPVKVHDKNGNSDLYSVLCGLVFAKKQGADIINASFGFYAPKKSPNASMKKKMLLRGFGVDLLKKFIEDHLKKNDILLVAAAGNKTTKAELRKRFGTNFRVPANQRDLGKVSFYPASFSTEMNNVIAVTTVNQAAAQVSSQQNFSPIVVDIGVRAEEPNNFGFLNPRTSKGFLRGSSYATPIVTGVIAANFSDFKKPFNKAAIIKALIKKGTLQKKDTLKKQIKDGIVL